MFIFVIVLIALSGGIWLMNNRDDAGVSPEQGTVGDRTDGVYNNASPDEVVVKPTDFLEYQNERMGLSFRYPKDAAFRSFGINSRIILENSSPETDEANYYGCGSVCVRFDLRSLAGLYDADTNGEEGIYIGDFIDYPEKYQKEAYDNKIIELSLGNGQKTKALANRGSQKPYPLNFKESPVFFYEQFCFPEILAAGYDQKFR